MLLFDTASVPAQDRTDALDAALNSAVMPQSFSFVSERVIRHRTEYWDLGPGIQLMRSTGAGLDTLRTARHVRQAAPEVIVLGLPMRSPILSAGPDGTETAHSPGGIVLLDTTRPYHVRYSEVMHHTSLLIEPARLSLPVDLMRAAAPALRASPVHDLVRSHMLHMCELSPEPGSEMAARLGRATAELVWALITAAAGDGGQFEALDATLDTRIGMYVDAHLHDTGMSASRIAAAHGISVRQLYKVWARAGHELTLSAWIAGRRLERARDQLSGPDATRSSITAIARACGFANPAHFSARFRTAFGVSPREWRRLSQEASSRRTTA